MASNNILDVPPILKFRSTTHDTSLARALDLVLENETSRAEWLSLSEPWDDGCHRVWLGNLGSERGAKAGFPAVIDRAHLPESVLAETRLTTRRVFRWMVIGAGMSTVGAVAIVKLEIFHDLQRLVVSTNNCKVGKWSARCFDGFGRGFVTGEAVLDGFPADQILD
jgi:hypothetical protein